MNILFHNIKSIAINTVGVIPPKKKTHYTNDPQVIALVEERHLLKLIESNCSDDRSNLRKSINNKRIMISKRLSEIANSKAEKLANEISSTDDCRCMFEAAHILSGSRKKTNITIINVEELNVGSDQRKAEIIKDWF